MQQQTDSTNSLLTIQTRQRKPWACLARACQVTTSTGAQTGSVTTITFQTDGTPQLAVKLADGTVLTGIGLTQVTVVQ